MEKQVILAKSFDRFLLFPILLFTTLFLPFLNTIPYLDGNIDFVKSYDMFTGGLSEYMIKWPSSHPPFKFFLIDIIYHVTGIQPIAFNLVGLVGGVVGIIAIYLLAEMLCNRPIARISAVLFAVSPMIIAIGISSLNDYIITVLMLLSLFFYCKRYYLRYVITASCLVLTKETGLLLPVSIILIEVCFIKQLLKQTKRDILISSLLAIPLFIFAGWLWFLKLNHQLPWSDWLFAPTASKGTFYTVAYNLLTFNFLNQYAYEQWLHLFILNFNWVYWLLAIIGIISFIRQNKLGFFRQGIIKGNQKTKTILVLSIFSLGYFFAVLTLQTYTIPRYVLPIFPLLFLLASIGIGKLWYANSILKWGSLVLLLLINFFALFYSVDPLSKVIWGETVVFGQTLYGVNNSLSGNDAITYNMQYLFIVRKRTNALTSKQTSKLDRSSCAWLFVDPRNDNQTITFLKVKNFSYQKACLP